MKDLKINKITFFYDDNVTKQIFDPIAAVFKQKKNKF